MLHGLRDAGDMWAPLAAKLPHDHTVIVPDLRGMGLSSHPEGGYDKKTQTGDIARVLDRLIAARRHGRGGARLSTNEIG
jgi:pimeloyl-ACP methyl ester carboxylesterase